MIVKKMYLAYSTMKYFHNPDVVLSVYRDVDINLVGLILQDVGSEK